MPITYELTLFVFGALFAVGCLGIGFWLRSRCVQERQTVTARLDRVSPPAGKTVQTAIYADPFHEAVHGGPSPARIVEG